MVGLGKGREEELEEGKGVRTGAGPEVETAGFFDGTSCGVEGVMEELGHFESSDLGGAGVGNARVGGGRGGKGSQLAGVLEGRGGLNGALAGVFSPEVVLVEVAARFRSRLPDLATGGGGQGLYRHEWESSWCRRGRGPKISKLWLKTGKLRRWRYKYKININADYLVIPST